MTLPGYPSCSDPPQNLDIWMFCCSTSTFAYMLCTVDKWPAKPGQFARKLDESAVIYGQSFAKPGRHLRFSWTRTDVSY
jgi:hypothetical protein